MQSPVSFKQRSHQQYSIRTLCLMIALAAAYTGWLLSQGTITGRNTWDGAIGIFLGIYVCSRPVGNALDLLFSQDSGRWADLFRRAGLTWLTLNFIVLLVGWFLITLGATRLPRPDL